MEETLEFERAPEYDLVSAKAALSEKENEKRFVITEMTSSNYSALIQTRKRRLVELYEAVVHGPSLYSSNTYSIPDTNREKFLNECNIERHHYFNSDLLPVIAWDKEITPVVEIPSPSSPEEEIASEVEMAESSAKHFPVLLPPSPPLTPVSFVSHLYHLQTKPVSPLVKSANKTMTSQIWSHGLREMTDLHVLARIEQLKSEGLWSLRQRKRAVEPERLKVHWDFLLEECQWMSSDFHQERIWKIAAAKMCADAVMDYWSVNDKAALLVRTREPNFLPRDDAMEIDEEVVETEPTDRKAFEEFRRRHPKHCDYLFGLSESDVVYSFKDDHSSAANLFNDLPCYAGLHAPIEDEAAAPLPPIVPISIYSHSQPKVKNNIPKEISVLDVEKETHHFVYRPGIVSFAPARDVSSGRKLPLLVYPPKPPPQSYIDSRIPTQWTVEEDERLILVAKELSYNFDAVADYLQPPMLFSNITERRTPWECFERWYNVDASANCANLLGPHVKSVQQRISSRKNKDGFRMDTSRRRPRCYAILESMRRLMKKRELMQKQVQTNKKPAVEKPEAARSHVPTPLELVKLKQDRDSKQQMLDINHSTFLTMQARASKVSRTDRKLTPEQINSIISLQRSSVTLKQGFNGQVIANNPALLAQLQQHISK